MAETQEPTTISTRLQRIAEIARKYPDQPMRTLAHHIDLEMLMFAFEKTRKDAAPGVDGEDYATFAQTAGQRLEALREQMHSGAYRAPPVRRVFVPKENGQQRPIGIPTLEDKILQRAVSTILTEIYEQSFLDCSYGFRPGRSAHQALEVIWKAIMARSGAWVIEADIESFFDTMDKRLLQEIFAKRIQDGVLRRMIGKWLNAGVMEEGQLHHTDAGTPQGGVISPLLANVYLHEVLDVWFEREVRPRLRKQATLVRFADDFVIIFESKEDAERVYEVLPKRFARYGLRLHPEKTRLLYCRPTPAEPGPKPSGSTTFDFLGFTHYWAKSRKGRWFLSRKTMARRFRRTMKRFWEWCRNNRHLEIESQQKALSRKLKGHYAYFGITSNFPALARLHYGVGRIWHYWLGRRSQRAEITWDNFNGLLKQHPLAKPRIVHSACAAG